MLWPHRWLRDAGRISSCLSSPWNWYSTKNPARQYEQNHTPKKDRPVMMEIHRKIAQYMTMLDLCEHHIPDLVAFVWGPWCHLPNPATLWPVTPGIALHGHCYICIGVRMRVRDTLLSNFTPEFIESIFITVNCLYPGHPSLKHESI